MGRYLKRLLPCILLFVLLPLPAQKRGYERGYVVTVKGDTLRGWVKDRSAEPFVELYRRIRFRPEGKRGRRKYGADQIRGYGAGGRIYEALPLREESAFFRFRYYLDPGAAPSFLKVIRKEGPLTWYEKEFTYDDNNYLDFYPLLHLRGSHEMVRVTQGILGLKKKRLAEYFQDCPGMAFALEEGDLSEVEQVFRFYLDSCASTDETSLSRGVYRIVETDSGKLQTPEKVSLSRRMHDLGVPGVGIAVIENYEIREVLSFGLTGKGTTVDQYTMFQAASVSKLVTALLVHRFVEAGLLDLDKDVNTYLRSWKIPENEFTKRQPITLRLLLSHQSGLPATDFGYLREAGTPSLNQILDGAPPALNKPAVPVKVPGAAWVYSNIGYVLIQKILEDHLGKPLQELGREALFEPAAMDLSTFAYPLPVSLAEHEALPHDKDGRPRRPELASPAKAQGGLLTTPEELARLLVEVLKASKWESGVFPKSMADGLLHSETALPFHMYNQKARMGLGALLLGDGKEVAFMHNGYNSPGSVCIAIGFPYLGKGAVITVNSANGEALYLEILATLAETYQWPTGQFFRPDKP